MEIVEGYIINKHGRIIKGDDWFWNEATKSIDDKVDNTPFTAEEKAVFMGPIGHTIQRAKEGVNAAYNSAVNSIRHNTDVKVVIQPAEEYTK